MNTQRLWMNVYRAGYFHCQGKAGHTNIHAGDFFTSEELAKVNVTPGAGYIGTVSFDMPVPPGTVVLSNPEGSVADPLRLTRENPMALMPWHTAPHVFPVAILNGGSCPLRDCPAGGWDSFGSIETSEAEAQPYMPSYAGHAMAGRSS